MNNLLNVAAPIASFQTLQLRAELERLQRDPKATFEKVKEMAVACAASAMGDIMDYEYAQEVLNQLKNKK